MAMLAAVVAAVELSWPRSVAAGVAPAPVDAARWRFSARWWSRSAASRRTRPW